MKTKMVKSFPDTCKGLKEEKEKKKTNHELNYVNLNISKHFMNSIFTWYTKKNPQC